MNNTEKKSNCFKIQQEICNTIDTTQLAISEKNNHANKTSFSNNNAYERYFSKPVTEHIKECSDCKRYVKDISFIEYIASSDNMIETPSELKMHVMAKISGHTRAENRDKITLVTASAGLIFHKIRTFAIIMLPLFVFLTATMFSTSFKNEYIYSLLYTTGENSDLFSPLSFENTIASVQHTMTSTINTVSATTVVAKSAIYRIKNTSLSSINTPDLTNSLSDRLTVISSQLNYISLSVQNTLMTKHSSIIYALIFATIIMNFYLKLMNLNLQIPKERMTENVFI